MTFARLAACTSAAAAASALPSRPLMTTSQPSLASASAQARPSPRLEAQTMALRPAMPRSMQALIDDPEGAAARVLSYQLSTPRQSNEIAPPSGQRCSRGLLELFPHFLQMP